MRPVRKAAHAMLGAIFVANGARALAVPDLLAPRAKLLTDRLAPVLEKTDVRLPTDARTLVRINGAAQLGGGLLMVSDHVSRPAAVLLAGSLIPTTVAGHPFWAVEDPAERRAQQIHFLKNAGLLGGLLLAAVDTGGRPGLRWRTGRMMHGTRRSLRRSGRTARREARIAARAARAGRALPARRR